MKLKLSYIGINTDNPTPILITENGMAIAATANSIRQAANEAFEYAAAMETALCDFDFQSRSTKEQDNP